MKKAKEKQKQKSESFYFVAINLKIFYEYYGFLNKWAN